MKVTQAQRTLWPVKVRACASLGSGSHRSQANHMKILFVLWGMAKPYFPKGKVIFAMLEEGVVFTSCSLWLWLAACSIHLYTIHRRLTCGNVGKKFKPFVRRLQKWGKIDGTGCIGKLFRRWVELKETSTFWDDLPACGPVFHYFLLSRTRETITAPKASKPQKFPQTFFSSWNGGDLQTGLALGLWPQLRWQRCGLALLRLQAPEGRIRSWKAKPYFEAWGIF